MDLMKMLEPKELLNFSQSYSIRRNYLGDTLFPDTKTKYLKAEFDRLSDQLRLPVMAQVHSFDTEAHIGQRPTMERVTIEKMYIKEKINVSERTLEWLNSGVGESEIVKYIFDDIGRLAESVKTRTEVAKMEALSTGKMTVNENGATFTIDYGVPSANIGSAALGWNNATADILGDIQNIKDTAEQAGQKLTHFITSSKVIGLMRKNEGIQTAIYSALGKGTYVSNTQLAGLVKDTFDVTLMTYDSYYKYEGKKGVLTAKRYLDEDRFVGICAMGNNSVGMGLWGPTPEELAQGAYTEKNQSQYITCVRWYEQDPVAVWTKAAGIFVPVIPNPSGLFINTITLA